MPEQYLSVHILDEEIDRYVGRRLKLKLKGGRSPLFQDGDIVTCIVGYYDEHAIDIDDEEENEFMGYGVIVSDALLNGTPAYLGSVPFVDIAGFYSLDGENTEEEAQLWFERASGCFS